MPLTSPRQTTQKLSSRSKINPMRASFTLLALLFAHLTISQERCGTISPSTGEFENWINRKIELRKELNPKARTQQNSTYEVPIVVHVLHPSDPIGEGINLSTERIQGQIDSLNVDFRRLNADTVNTPESFLPVAADTEISFVLARQDPAGNPTNGIVRVNTAPDYSRFRTNSISDMIAMRAYSHWPPDNYLNIYCVDLSGGFIGLATFPETDLPGITPEADRFYLDGVLLDYLFFGNNPTTTSFESRGRTLTHEIGHILGLRHIWGSTGCGSDDFVSDTPLADTDNGGYTSPCTFPNPEDNNVCVEDEPEMFQNYMDYTDDVCMNLFTQGQKDRMRTVLENSPRRSSLRSSPGLFSPTLFENDLTISKIISPDLAECSNQITPIIQVTNHGLNEITEYQIALFINGQEEFTLSKSTALMPFESEALSFPNQIVSGDAFILFRIIEVNNGIDGNSTNNVISKNLDYVTSTNLPFIQDFESANEMLGTFGVNKTWDVVIAPEISPSNRSIVFQSFNNNTSFAEDLKITTPPLDMNGVNTAALSFKYAYSGSPNNMHDGLIVRGSTDCGDTYPNILFSEVGPPLQTVIPSSAEFIPSNELEWREIVINISDYQNTDGVRFQFQGINGSNNIYLDDIVIEATNILENDISLESIQGPLVTCNANVDLELEVKNAGSDPVTSFTIEGVINGQSFTQTFEDIFIEYQEYKNFKINISTLTEIENSITISVDQVNGRTDESSISNSVEASINIDAQEDEFPLTVDFEKENQWITTSPQRNSLWRNDDIDGNNVLRASSFQEQTLGIQSWFVSPALSTGGLDSAGLYFRISYANRQGFNDQFRVLLSSNCGKTFDEVLLEANSDSLAVTESGELWRPDSDEDWKEFSLDISQTIEVGDSIRIAFVMVNGNGNDLFLDDISIRGNEPVTYQDVFRVYPNPASTTFKLGLNLPEKEPVLIEMIDMSGKLVITKDMSNAFNQILSFSVPKNPGLYFIRIAGANFVQTQKLFVNAN